MKATPVQEVAMHLRSGAGEAKLVSCPPEPTKPFRKDADCGPHRVYFSASDSLSCFGEWRALSVQGRANPYRG